MTKIITNYKTPADATYDVLGVGSAIVDVLAQIDDDFLVNEQMHKGTMALIDDVRAEELYDKLGACTECSGGSVANSLAGMADLGAKTAFMGRVKDDQLGNIFRHDMRSVGVDFDTPAATEGKPTARCFICVTPDAERTMNTYIGGSSEFTPEGIDKQRIADSGITFLEGYLWDYPQAIEAMQLAAATAKRTGRKVAFSLSDLFCVERHRDTFLELIHQYVDILFANEQEAVALTKSNNLQDAIEQIGSMVEVAAITCNKDGVWVSHMGDAKLIATSSIDEVVDTTGAGDMFAAGFLYGLTKGWDMEKSANLGHKCAGEIIQQIGARPMNSLKELVA